MSSSSVHEEGWKLLQTLIYTFQFFAFFFWQWLIVIIRDSSNKKSSSGCRSMSLLLDGVLDILSLHYEHVHFLERQTRKGIYPSIIKSPIKALHEEETSTTDGGGDCPVPADTAVPILFPESVLELQDYVKKSKNFRAIGSGHSWRQVIDVTNNNGVGNNNDYRNGNGGTVLISLAKMNQILHVDEERKRVTVQAGIKLFDLTRLLHKKYNLALQNMGNYDRQSLGGAIVGGTHGTSGSSQIDTFTNSIVELKMISAKDGQIVTLMREDSVNYGLGGIIYEVTLDVVEFYYLKSTNTIIPNPSSKNIDFTTWLSNSSSAAEQLWIRWAYPGRPHQVCQLIEYTRCKNEKEYYQNRNIVDRTIDTWMLGGCNILPKIFHHSAPILMNDKTSIDKYYYQLIPPLIPHIIGLEYAVPITSNINTLIDKIPSSLTKLWKHFDMVEVDFRVTPPDKAYGHLSYSGDDDNNSNNRNGCIWFGLYVGLPPNKQFTDDEFRTIFEEYENLMIHEYGGVAHPHKYAVSKKGRSFPPRIIQYLQKFQQKYDPEKKMMCNNPALNELLGGGTEEARQ